MPRAKSHTPPRGRKVKQEELWVWCHH
jgi:hypothetical protein